MGGKRNVLKWHLFMLWHKMASFMFLCLLVSGETSSWSLLSMAPHSRKLEYKLGKVLNGLSSYLTTWKSKGLSFVGPEKIIQKKSQENIHLMQNVSPNIECKLWSQEGDGGPNPAWEAQTLCSWADDLMSPGQNVCFASKVNLLEQNLFLER